MDRPIPPTARPVTEPRVVLPLDLDEDFADDSIYGMGYRSRARVVTAREGEAADTAAAAAGAPIVARG